MDDSIEVYLEIGKKKIAAGAIDWPGWCRLGRSEEEALAALLTYGRRYGRVLARSGLPFLPPAAVSDLVVVERLEGNATTDFGAPDASPKADERPFGEPERQQAEAVLTACWLALDEAVKSAEGKTLQKGPRGGGRELEGIMEHVLEADRAYLSALGWRFKREKGAGLQASLDGCRAAILEGLAAAARGEIEPIGPRGGKRWTPHYFLRRSAWHLLDHLWEIEDRVQ